MERSQESRSVSTDKVSEGDVWTCRWEGEWMRESGVSVITLTSHIRWGAPVTMGASWFRRTGSMGMGSCMELDGPEGVLAVGMES